MNKLYIVFSVAYFGLLIWGFFLGRNSVFDNWFNDVIWEKVLDENGNPIMMEEDLEEVEMTDEQRIQFLQTLIETAKQELDEIELKKKDSEEKKE